MDQRQNKVLEAARSLFDRFGVKKTTMDEVAKAAAISKKTLYEFFRSKEELFVAVFIDEAFKARKSILEQVGHVQDPVERLKAIVPAAVGYFSREPFMVKILRDEDNLYLPFLAEPFRLQVEEGILDLLGEVLEEGMQTGKFRTMKVRTAAYFVFKLFQAVTYFRSGSIAGDEEDMRELLTFVLAAIEV